ncbi:hypothetical protein [Agromyces sp. SYSU T00194]|uniref:hypothetical protein n=1 Tax=Agromyces chitinivorans TaxID=3158560 RepID=UPI003395FBEF
MEIIYSFDPALILQLVIATVLPLLVGLVTKTVTHPGIKAALLALFAMATSLLTELLVAVQAGVAYDLGTGLLGALPTFLVGVGLHYGFWKPTGASAAAQRTFVKDAGTVGDGPADITSLPEG